MKSRVEDFYWCNWGCNTWHDRTTDTGFHYALVVWPEEEPTERNFPGTPGELARVIAYRRLMREDTAARVASLDARIDAAVRGGT